MSLSNTTITILRNFARINEGLVFYPGNKLQTISVMKNIFACATIRQAIPFEFAILDLNKFLKTCSTMKNSEGLVNLYFRDGGLVVKNKKSVLQSFTTEINNIFFPDGERFKMPVIEYETTDQACIIFKKEEQSITYPTCPQSAVISPGDKRIVFPEDGNNTKFILGKIDLKKILEASKVMKLKDLTVTETGILLHNRNGTSNQMEIELPDIDYSGQDTHIKVENLKLMPLDYDVEISPKGLARFTSKDKTFKIVYYLALEND